MALFILDFDETITSENTHNAVSHLTEADEMWDVIKAIEPMNDAEIWRTTLSSILATGHDLAIASFNAYGRVFIPQYLREVIGLNEEEVQAIHIESWLPLKPGEANKNEHIACAIKDMKYLGSPDTIVLVDDDLKNVTAAGKNGYKTIHAAGKYIEHIQHLRDDWNYSAPSDHGFMHHLLHAFGLFQKANLPSVGMPIPDSEPDSDNDSDPDSNCKVM